MVRRGTLDYRHHFCVRRRYCCAVPELIKTVKTAQLALPTFPRLSVVERCIICFLLTHVCLSVLPLIGYGTGSTNSGGGKQTLSLSERTFKRVTQTSNTSHSGGTVSVKQEGATVDNLVPGFVDSTTFVTSPTVQQTNVRQQGSSQTAEQRTGEDCEPVPLPSKSKFRSFLLHS